MDKTSFQAGKAQGTVQEKSKQVFDQVGNAANSVMGSAQEAGKTIQTKAVEATEAVKKATGLNK